MLSVEATGRNIEQAIQNALFELKAPREDCDIKILEEGGLFKKAKVLVSISADEVEKYQKREQAKNALLSEAEEKEKPTTSIIPTKEELEAETVVEDHDEEIEVISSENQEHKAQKQEKDIDKAKYFLKGILNKTSLTGDVEIREEGDEIFANIVGCSDIIGYRGEGLNALQYLTSVIVSKNNRHAKKVRIDCDNYRAKREASLIALAQRMAKKVERTHASVKLEPMSANERRIIHTALAESLTVETFSKGEEPHRYLIIKPKSN